MSVTTAPARAAVLASLRPVAGRADLAAGVAAAVAGVVAVAFARLLAGIVDEVVFAGAGIAAIAPELAGLAAVAAVRAAAGHATERFAFAAAAAVRRALFARLLERVGRLGPVRLATRPPGTVVAAVTEAVDAVAPLWRSWRPAAIRAAVVPVCVLAAVVRVDPIATAIFLLALPLLVWFSILAGRGAEEASGRQWASLARLGGHLLDQIRGLAETKLAGTSGRAVASVEAAATAYGRRAMAVLRLAFLSALVLEFVATAAIAGVAMAVGFRLMWGSMGFADGFFVLLLAPEFFAPLREIGVRRHARIEAFAALDTIADLLGDDAETPPPTGAPAPEGPPAIRFEGVRVVHADGRVALDRLDLDVAAGERIALVGPSGAGKSTVLALLARFVEPTAGRILIDGRPLAEIDVASWRARLAYLPQTPPFFDGTIADNVVMGRAPDDGDRRRRLDRALEAAGAAAFVARLPLGVDTPLAEAGDNLSGGERRRLALARAVFGAGPLLLLDEPTAQLDEATERTVVAAIAALAPGRTTLVVSHRPEAVAGVDRVVRIEAGRVAEPARRDGDA